jgi:hypothetical protein
MTKEVIRVNWDMTKEVIRVNWDMTKELIGVIFPQIDRYFPFHGSKILSIVANFRLKCIIVRNVFISVYEDCV